jgi:hypothetical protein
VNLGAGNLPVMQQRLEFRPATLQLDQRRHARRFAAFAMISTGSVVCWRTASFLASSNNVSGISTVVLIWL